MCESAFAAARGSSSASAGFCALGPLRAAFIEPPRESRHFQATGRREQNIDARRWLPAWQHRRVWT
jgi:hypothetical protein